MGEFFVGSRPGRTVTHGDVTFDLPILYHRDDLFGLFFSASFERVAATMPSAHLHPATLPGVGGRALVGVVAFNYFDTSIGPYGEVGIVVPVVYGEKPPPAVIPLLLEGSWPGYGYLVLHLPVTTTMARDAGRGEWGYTKFVADMRFTTTPEYHECYLSEGASKILMLRTPRKGMLSRDTRPLVTYSVRSGDLVKTVIPQQGICRNALLPRAWRLEPGDHEVAESLRRLELSSRPLLARTYIERSAILPAGEVIEREVLPLDGYRGEDRQGVYSSTFWPSDGG